MYRFIADDDFSNVCLQNACKKIDNTVEFL